MSWVRPGASRLSGELTPWLTKLDTLQWHSLDMKLMQWWHLVVLLGLTIAWTLLVTRLILVRMLSIELLGQNDWQSGVMGARLS